MPPAALRRDMCVCKKNTQHHDLFGSVAADVDAGCKNQGLEGLLCT